MSSSLKKELCPETSNAKLNSRSITNKPSKLANTLTLFLCLLLLFSLVESNTSRLFHLTQTCLQPPLRNSSQLHSGLLCNIPTLAGPASSTPSPAALFLSKVLDGQPQTSQTLESVPLASFALKSSATDSFSLVTTSPQHKILTASGKSCRPQTKNLSASPQTPLANLTGEDVPLFQVSVPHHATSLTPISPITPIVTKIGPKHSGLFCFKKTRFCFGKCCYHRAPSFYHFGHSFKE